MTVDLPLQGRHILIIEDDFMIAQILADLIEEAGAEVVGPFGWVEDALAFIENHGDAFDSAVLDVNLHDEKSYPIADKLVARNVKFVFSTGYGAEAIDAAYRKYPRCEKPFNLPVLVEALGGVCKGR